MATRLHRIGNIYSRVDGLIRKGHMKETSKPIWFDVYRSFPPKYEPTFKRKPPEVQVKEIFYKEDILRAKIHKAFRGRTGWFDLQGRSEIFSEKLLKIVQEYVSEGMSEDEAVEKVKHRFDDVEKRKEGPQTEVEIEKLLSDIFV